MHVIPAVLLYINVLITACCSSAEANSSPTASSWQRLFNAERNTDPPTGLSSAQRVLEHIQTPYLINLSIFTYFQAQN